MEPQDTLLPQRLGRPFIDKVESVGRKLTHVLPHYTIPRKEGISAIVLLLDEPMAYASIESILPYVDEVVVVDASDTITHIPTHKKITYVLTPAEQNMQVKIGMLLSQYRWILRWDGDFLPSAELSHLLDIPKHYPDGYWQVKTWVRNIDKQNQPVLIQKECYLFTYHPEILTADYKLLKQFTDVVAKVKGGLPGRICYGTLPYFFGDIKTDYVFANHYFESKSDARLTARQYQAQWSMLSDAERNEYTNFQEYVNYHSDEVPI